MSWRYQPVIVIEGKGKSASCCVHLIEVHFDDEGNLTGWTDQIAPVGDDLEDLSGELTRMLVDLWRWQPVLFSNMKPGMKFKRMMSPDRAEAVAQFVERTVNNFRRYYSLQT